MVYSPSEEVRFYILTCHAVANAASITHFCSLCKVPDDKDEQSLPNEQEKTHASEELEESIEYEGIICDRVTVNC